MATFSVEGGDLVLELTPFEKVEGLHGTIREPLSAVTRIRAVADPWSELRGIRAPGTGIPGVVAVGTRRGHDVKDFAAIHGKGPAVVVDLESGTYRRLLATVENAPAVAAALAARCPHAAFERTPGAAGEPG
jgi:hypothetical protein